MYNYKEIEKCCVDAINGLRGILTEAQIADCLVYAEKHGEYLLSLEFVVDYLTEFDKIITKEQYEKCRSAFRIMNEKQNERMVLLARYVNLA